MKNILFSLFTLCSVSIVNAQQEALFAQYYNNPMLINPATVGSTQQHELRLFHRWQWVAFAGAPITAGVSYQGLFKKKHGIGGTVYYDQTGPTSSWGAKLSYAFHIPINEMRLSIGLAGRFQQNRVNTAVIDLINPNDNALQQNSAFLGDAEVGALFYGEKFYFGVSAPNLLQTKFDLGTNSNRTPIAQQYRHFFIYGGYKFKLGKVSLEPSIMGKWVQGTPFQIDGGVRMHFLKNQMSVGLAYRTPGALSLMYRVVFDKQFPLCVSFDIATSSFQNYSFGSYELMLGYDWPRRDRLNDPFMSPPPTIDEEKMENRKL
jgi:type IX secretion system PorP/SprF family membrane protein